MNTNLWKATNNPNYSIENVMRARRVRDFLLSHGYQATYQDIRSNLGLSYAQTVRAVGLLVHLKYVEVTVKAVWNGMYYIYPHVVCIP